MRLSEAKRSRHKRSEMSTTDAGCPGRSSLSVKFRPQDRPFSEERKKRRRYASSLEARGLRFVVQVHLVGAEGGDRFERALPRHPIAEVSRRNADTVPSQSRLGLVQADEPFRVFEIERPQHPRFEAREHPRVRTDADGKDEDNRQCPAGVVFDLPDADADVLDHSRSSKSVPSQYRHVLERFSKLPAALFVIRREPRTIGDAYEQGPRANRR